jgi:hypothetical protein
VPTNRAENIFPKHLLYYLHEIAWKYPRERKYSSSFYDSAVDMTVGRTKGPAVSALLLNVSLGSSSIPRFHWCTRVHVLPWGFMKESIYRLYLTAINPLAFIVPDISFICLKASIYLVFSIAPVIHWFFIKASITLAFLIQYSVSFPNNQMAVGLVKASTSLAFLITSIS